MQHKNTELMKQINTYIGEFFSSQDRTPSTTEIAKRFGISRSSAHVFCKYEITKVAEKMEKVASPFWRKLQTARQGTDSPARTVAQTQH